MYYRRVKDERLSRFWKNGFARVELFRHGDHGYETRDLGIDWFRPRYDCCVDHARVIDAPTIRREKQGKTRA